MKVISGKFKNTVADVQTVLSDKVWLKGVNVAKKAVKGKGFVEKTLPIHVSNVQFYVESSKKVSRIGVEVVKNKKVRVLRQIKNEQVA